MLCCAVWKSDNVFSALFYFPTKDSHLRKLDDIAISLDSASYLGMATVNKFGTEFTIHDHRATPEIENSDLRELGVVR